ncbi:MAG: hypothetical protein K9N51_06695, partial [Candidatus Pacebacteria bacterium]|nr:hypothetical protein [Candidatus Paceibacterota bacterium]
ATPHQKSRQAAATPDYALTQITPSRITNRRMRFVIADHRPFTLLYRKNEGKLRNFVDRGVRFEQSMPVDQVLKD